MPTGKTEPVRLVSMNVKGLNTPEKRSMVLTNLKHMKAHVCFLQETHFRADKLPRLHDRFFPTVYHGCSSDSKSKGVSILIRGDTPWQLKDQWGDAEGRALFVKGTLGRSLVTLVNLYLPNANQIAFLEPIMTKLVDFAEGMVIMGGDMNFVMDPILDSSRGVSQVSYASLKRLKKNFHALHLVDVWRILHPSHKDFTFYSHPHDSYTRIDMLMVPQAILSRVSSASIGSITFSDHAPVFIDIDLLHPCFACVYLARLLCGITRKLRLLQYVNVLLLYKDAVHTTITILGLKYKTDRYL